MSTEKPELTHVGIFDCQVCVPKDWTDEQAIKLAETEAPCGTSHGWQVRKSSKDERVQCESRPGFVHIMLDA